MNNPTLRPNLRQYGDPFRRRGGWAWVIVIALVIVLGFFFMGRTQLARNDEQAIAEIHARQTEGPKEALLAFYTERARPSEAVEGRWRMLLDFMSRQDREWFERNYPLIATLRSGITPPSAEPEKQHAAVEELLREVPHGAKPVIVQTQQNGDCAAVFIHDPGQPQTLREVCMIKEEGRWKIRRFFGSRDKGRFMEPVIRDKNYKSQPLDADEQQYSANPAGFAAMKHKAMLAEAGQPANR